MDDLIWKAHQTERPSKTARLTRREEELAPGSLCCQHVVWHRLAVGLHTDRLAA